MTEYNKNQAGTYTITGTLNLPEGITNPENLQPEVQVTVDPWEIVSVGAVSGLSVDTGTSFGDLTLPSTVTVTLDNAETEDLNVTWLEGDYDGDVADTYTLTGTIQTTNNIINPDNLTASIDVEVEVEVEVVIMGTFRHNGNPIPWPTRQWRDSIRYDGTTAETGNYTLGEEYAGNIPLASGSDGERLDGYSFGDSDPDDANNLRWVTFEYDNKQWFILTGHCVAHVSWNDIDAQGWVDGEEVTIDGVTGTIRLLTGGALNRDDETAATYAGGALPNEWDKFIMNGFGADNHWGSPPVIAGLPEPNSLDWDTTSSLYANPDSMSRDHNQVWWWNTMYSWCQETVTGQSTWRVSRGYGSARRWRRTAASHVGPALGFRPAFVVEL